MLVDKEFFNHGYFVLLLGLNSNLRYIFFKQIISKKFSNLKMRNLRQRESLKEKSINRINHATVVPLASILDSTVITQSPVKGKPIANENLEDIGHEVQHIRSFDTLMISQSPIKVRETPNENLEQQQEVHHVESIGSTVLENLISPPLKRKAINKDSMNQIQINSPKLVKKDLANTKNQKEKNYNTTLTSDMLIMLQMQLKEMSNKTKIDFVEAKVILEKTFQTRRSYI